MKLSCIVVIASWAVLCSGQEVHTSQVKDGVNLSISSPQSYEIIAGEKKRPNVEHSMCPESERDKGTASSDVLRRWESVGRQPGAHSQEW